MLSSYGTNLRIALFMLSSQYAISTLRFSSFAF